jgi:hypothetical protein
MKLTCPQCGTVYDVSQYAEGHTFQCQCGRELKVGAHEPPPVTPAGAPPVVSDPGFEPIVKVLVFFGNLCFSPLATIASIIVWFVIKEQRPRTAKDLCQMTWIPFVVWAVLVGLYLLFVGMAIFTGFMGSVGNY